MTLGYALMLAMAVACTIILICTGRLERFTYTPMPYKPEDQKRFLPPN